MFPLIVLFFLLFFFDAQCTHYGWDKVNAIVPNQLKLYLATKEIAAPVACQLDQLFEDLLIQQAFEDLEDVDHFELLMDAGFIFLSPNKNVFMHKNFPNYVFKIPRTDDQLLLTIGRVWCADLIRYYAQVVVTDVPIIVPAKWLYFSSGNVASNKLGVIVVAEKINLTHGKRLKKKQMNVLRSINSWLRGADFHPGNVINCDGCITFLDTEPWNVQASLDLLIDLLNKQCIH
ncbi:MAG TPA: hypothetical protein VFF04_01390 [Candidatus Babeliales bacterium]|nr:hypothetical protein [Candidatus Babeliales bacterium]